MIEDKTIDALQKEKTEELIPQKDWEAPELFSYSIDRTKYGVGGKWDLITESGSYS